MIATPSAASIEAAGQIADRFALEVQRTIARKLVKDGMSPDEIVAAWPDIATRLRESIVVSFDQARQQAQQAIDSGMGGWASACFTTEAQALGIAIAADVMASRPA